MRTKLTLATLAAIALALTGCMAPDDNVTGRSNAISMQPAVDIDAASNIEMLRALDETFADIAEFVSGAVVHIQAKNDVSEREAFFGGVPMGGIGSGFIYRSDGWIITNDHVVAGMDEVTVVLKDGREFEGEVIRSHDVNSDLAVIKIDAQNLPTLEFADSSEVRPGQFAIAIGSPFGFDQTVTVGHISGIGRHGAVIDQRSGAERVYAGMIQTDASINPGNSGGPLIDVNGRVVGINTTIYSESGGSQGIGFAIPARQAKIVADTLIKDGKLNRGFLGLLPVTPKPYQAKKMGVEDGALVVQVEEGSPAAQAGLEPEDVIVRIGDEEINSELDLRVTMYQHAPGSEIEIAYIRDGERDTTTLTVGELPDEMAMNAQPQQPLRGMPDFFDDEQSLQPDRAMLGVTVGPLDETARAQFNIPADVKGVVVVSVAPGMPAAAAGIEVGDIILAMDGEQINSPTELAELVSDHEPGDSARLAWRRFGEEGTASFERTVEF